jgi:glycosyltransferase involved in cell wall biosynthesis
LSERVRLMGFTKHVRNVLTAADALVSPTHYDAYGLGVHEALCCGLPAFVTRSAGVAERYPDELADLLLDDPPKAEDLVLRLQRWRADMTGYRARVADFSQLLRQRRWTDMSREIVELITTDRESQINQRTQPIQ